MSNYTAAYQAIDQHSDLLIGLAQKIWDNPEVAYT